MTVTRDDGAEPCDADPAGFIHVEPGTVPLVITSVHAGDTAVSGCDPGDSVARPLEARTCSADLDAQCVSGPCRAGGADRSARAITLALVEDLERCLGGRPHL